MISKLSRYIQGTTWIFVVAAPLLMVVEVLCDLMQPTLMSQIIDVGVASGDMAEVWRTGGIMISVAFNRHFGRCRLHGHLLGGGYALWSGAAQGDV